jgi:hypothetical protein
MKFKPPHYLRTVKSPHIQSRRSTYCVLDFELLSTTSRVKPRNYYKGKQRFPNSLLSVRVGCEYPNEAERLKCNLFLLFSFEK